ncbi:hypothetical protein RND81_11G224200 [Saponaria officinalis]|uniref:Uncharacterized protein n=1 Tax=Saponaria officinalis TaxID=3572 RepID=A0AAW1HQ44_SAPOF
MGENKSTNLHRESNIRPALGDVTNQLGFSLVTRNPSSSSKTLSGRKRVAEDSDDDSLFWKQVSLVVEKLEKETRSAPKCPKIEPNEVVLSPLRVGKTYRLQNGCRDDVVEIHDDFRSTLDSIDLGENQHLPNVVSLDAVAEVGKECRGEGSDCNAEELAATRVVSDNAKSVGGDSMTSSRSESAETSRFTDSHETRSFGLEKCTLLKGDGSGSLASDMDLIKNCRCSFCAKAAYMWSDLQCQDIKGRISTLTKSKKEASILSRRHSVETAMGVAQESSNTGPHLETNLSSLWKSLFLHIENNFATESSQLQSSLAVLKDVREDYKLNLEMINEMIPVIQQCSSEVSDHAVN